MKFRVVALIAIALGLLVLLLVRLLRPSLRGEALAYTECPLRGEPRVTVNAGVAAEDTFPVRLHEEVHAAQCRELGALRYGLRNLTARGRLSLEIPGYCAGARARLKHGMDPSRVRERVLDDATAAFDGTIESSEVRQALKSGCGDVVQ